MIALALSAVRVSSYKLNALSFAANSYSKKFFRLVL